MNNNIRLGKIRKFRKSLGKRALTSQINYQKYEEIKGKLLDDIKLEIE